MSDAITEILKKVDDIEVATKRAIKRAYETDPRVELTPVTLHPDTTISELYSFCSAHDFTEIRYNFSDKQFFGVRLIEDQPD